ncbi:MAG: hypothetical protein GY869_32020, partial [Planctomycetes bacterium]|nr:hypothetical protein [Planctomycetota bacterium]
LEKDVNGDGNFGSSYNFSGTLADGQVFVIAHTSADEALIALADDTNGGALNFNGNDQVRLLKNGIELDRIGIPGGDNFGQNVTYVRKSFVSDPQSGPQDPGSNGEWDEYAQDTFDYLGFHNCISTTMVQFSSAEAAVNEGDGIYNLTVSIINPDAVNATTADVVLVSGDAADIGNYTTQTVTFAAGSSTDQTVTITITDDSEIEGDEIFVFELQNVNGGDNAAVGTPSQFDLTIEDNDAGPAT